MPKYSEELTGVFHALADPTRRSVLESLSKGPASAGELAQPFAMALPSFMQHMAVLEESRLVASEKRGRVRIYRLSPAPLKKAEGWLLDQRSIWEKRLDQLDNYLRKLKDGRK